MVFEAQAIWTIATEVTQPHSQHIAAFTKSRLVQIGEEGRCIVCIIVLIWMSNLTA
jgi:hypothetical protein